MTAFSDPSSTKGSDSRWRLQFCALWLISLSCLTPTRAPAQESPSISEFTGIIQYLKGPVHWQKRPDRNDKEKIEFKTLLHPGDEIVLEGSSYLKVISTNRCVGAIYNPVDPKDKSTGILAVPENPNSSWKVQGSASVRWICPAGQNDFLVVGGQKVFIEGGEIFFHREQLLPISGKITSTDQKLEPKQAYQFKEGQWTVAIAKDAEFEIWNFNSELPAPKESVKWNRPTKEFQQRWALTFMKGEMEINHPKDELEIKDSKQMGARLWHHRKGKNGRSNLFALTFNEIEEDDHQKPNQGPMTGPPVKMKVDAIMLQAGQRLNHERSWSLYWLGGFGSHKAKFNGCVLNCSLGSVHREVEFLALSLSFGVDKLLFNDWLRWGGLYLGIEGFYSYAAYRAKRNRMGGDNINLQTARDLRMESPFSTYGVMFSVGPALMF